METPNNSEGRLTEALMAAIRDHLKREPSPQESHHYNRAYEAIYAVLRTVHCDRCSGATFSVKRK